MYCLFIDITVAYTPSYCSFPFTYLGQLYYQCLQTVYDAVNQCSKSVCVSSFGRTLATCLPSFAGRLPNIWSFIGLESSNLHTSPGSPVKSARARNSNKSSKFYKNHIQIHIFPEHQFTVCFIHTYAAFTNYTGLDPTVGSTMPPSLT